MIRAKPFPRIMLRRRSQPPNGSLPWDTIMGNLSLARLVSGERTHAVFSPSISHLTPRPLSTVSRKPGLHPLDIEDGIYECDDLLSKYLPLKAGEGTLASPSSWSPKCQYISKKRPSHFVILSGAK